MRIIARLVSSWLLILPLAAQPDSPREIVRAKSEAARAALQTGDYPKAVLLYRELATLLPHLPGPRMNLGIAQYMDGQYRDAVQTLEKMGSKEGEFAPALLFLGASHFQLGETARAVTPLQDYLEAQPADTQARGMLAEALFGLKKYQEASEQFRRLTAQQPESPRLWHSLGQCYEALALQAFEQLNASAAESAQWLALLADLRLAQQQYQSAFFLYRKALEKETLRGLHVAVSQIYRATGHPDWAELEQQKELQLGLPDCESEPMVCDFLAGRLLEVVAAAEQQNTIGALYWKSKAYNRLALGAYSRLAQLPPSFELYAVTAETQSNNGRHQDAAVQWRKALELSPGNPIARRELATSLYLARDYDAADLLVEELLGKEPRSAQLNFLAGAIRLNREQAGEAVPFLEKAVEYDSKLVAARSALGRAYMALGQPEKAIPQLEAALPSDTDGSLHYQLSRAYLSSGRGEEARAMLARYQQIQERSEVERAALSEDVQITPP